MFNPCKKKDDLVIETISFKAEDHKDNKPDEFVQIDLADKKDEKKDKVCIIL